MTTPPVTFQIDPDAPPPEPITPVLAAMLIAIDERRSEPTPAPTGKD